MAIKKKHKGAYNEHSAILWLLEQGYDVFENVSSHGTVDLIAISDKGEIILLDVKGMISAYITPEQGILNVKTLAKKDGLWEIIEPKIMANDSCCLNCGKKLPISSRSHRTFCSRHCSDLYNFGEETICECCGLTFIKSRKAQRFCGVSCRQKANRRKHLVKE